MAGGSIKELLTLYTMEKLTKEKALFEVKKIEHIKSDDEMAHSLEDDLRNWFIACLSDDLYTKKESIEIAKIVLRTNDIELDRWCA